MQTDRRYSMLTARIRAPADLYLDIVVIDKVRIFFLDYFFQRKRYLRAVRDPKVTRFSSGAGSDVAHTVEAGFGKRHSIQSNIKMLQHLLADEPDKVSLVHGHAEFIRRIAINNIGKNTGHLGREISKRKLDVHAVVSLPAFV